SNNDGSEQQSPILEPNNSAPIEGEKASSTEKVNFEDISSDEEDSSAREGGLTAVWQVDQSIVE
ncbi:hypothetical protein A2U01_0117868, partial [Trifolium medium]|nr:hypothetical protein [Trifolium medium]